MTAITHRLRAEVRLLSAGTFAYTPSYLADVLNEAANEIDRLNDLLIAADEHLARIAELEAERGELQAVFDGTWKADQRAIKRWQAANPGNDLVWPDRADMVVWLLGREAELEAGRVEDHKWFDPRCHFDGCRSLTLEAALKRLSFAAQTTGGTAGRDEELVAAIEQAEAALLPKASVREERGCE